MNFKVFSKDELTDLSAESWKNAFELTPSSSSISLSQIISTLHNGPFLAYAKLGPDYFADEAIELKGQVPNKPDLSVFGWQKGAKQSDLKNVICPVIVCGAQDSEAGVKHVYYRVAQLVGRNMSFGFEEHVVKDERVFVTSPQKFSSTVIRMHPQATVHWKNGLAPSHEQDSLKSLKKEAEAILKASKEALFNASAFA